MAGELNPPSPLPNPHVLNWGELREAIHAWGVRDDELIEIIHLDARVTPERLEIHRTPRGIAILAQGHLWTPSQ